MDVVQVVSTVAVVAAVVTALMTLRERHRPGPALPVAAMLLLAALWAIVGLLLGAVDSVGAKAAVFRLIFPIGALLAGAALWQAAVLAGRSGFLHGRRLLLLLLEPVVIAVVAVTDPAHHLLLASTRVEGEAFYLTFGPLAWVHIVLCFALVGLAVAWMVAAMRQAIPAHRWRYGAAILALGLPLLGAIISVDQVSSVGARDLAGALSVVTAAVWWWAGLRHEAAASVPIGLGQVLTALGDAVVVVDPSGRVVQANPAAERLVRSAAPDVAQVTGVHWASLIDSSTAEQIRSAAQLVTLNGRVFDVRVTGMHAAGRRNGTVVVLRDVTDVERLRAELADQATHDGLTGMRNRRYLDQVADSLVSGARRRGVPLVAVMVDIDHFKLVNDLHGHAVGDVVLQAVARELMAQTRPDDVWVRFGGEEFIALVPDADLGTVLARAEELCRRCRDLRVPSPTGEIAVTVSIGLVARAADGTLDELLRAVDVALYQAKASGRDQVAIGLAVAEPVSLDVRLAVD